MGKKYFFVPKEIHQYEYLHPYASGLPLGEEKGNKFYPSLPLFSWISQHTEKKAVITDKAAWLFLCGRDIPKAAVISRYGNGYLLVQSKEDDNLGYGLMTATGIKNMADRGDYLRRERKSSNAR